MASKETYHGGEIAIQELTGERESAIANGHGISDAIVGGAIPFLSQQRFAVFSGGDPDGRIWVSMLTGPTGFVRAESDGKRIAIDLPRSGSPEDPVFGAITEGDTLGGLFIELATRRRLRVNGRVIRVRNGGVALEVEQSYGNCPKYIQRRSITGQRSGGAEPVGSTSGKRLDGTLERVISSADTLFVGSADNCGHFDASHRGGAVGFVETLDDETLRVPDYPGNSMFNTLGNFHINPKAGLLFIDFETSLQYHLTGTASLQLQQTGNGEATGGANRSWDFRLEKWRSSPLGQAFVWEFVDFSPFNPTPKRG